MSELAAISPQTPTAPAAVLNEVTPLRGTDTLHKNPLQSYSIQRKLTVGAPEDPYEREADAVADSVMRMPEQNFVQRKCNHCEEEEKVQRKPLSASITPFIQTKSENAAAVSEGVAGSIHSSRGGGSLLDGGTQSFMSSRMGSDFSNVTIHNDDQSAQLSQNLSAKAFTVGNDIYFNQGQYQPQSSEGKRLLAHELTHTIQQGDVAPATAIQRQEDPRVEAIKEKLRKGGKLTEEDIAYLKQNIGKEIVQQIMGGAGQIVINFDSSRKPEDINRRFQGRLELRMSGLPKGVAGSFEGIATADIDLVATLAKEKAVITVGPPAEKNRMAAMIRQQLFPNGASRSFDFDFPKEYFKYANSIWLISGITISVTGPGMKSEGAMISISHESVPAGVELIMTLAPSGRTTSVEETKRELPSDHWTLTPSPRIFGAAGYGNSLGSHAFSGTLGADFPLAYDTKNPLVYAGLGVRGSVDSNISGRAGGTAFVGLNIDPLSLQMGFGTGAAFLPEPVMTKDGPAQTVLYHEIEGMAAYRMLPNFELLMILSTGGGKNLPTYGTAQLGAGYRF